MRYASQDNGNYGDDATLKGIEGSEEGEGFGIPGQSLTVGDRVTFRRKADIGNEDENSTRLTALGDEPKDKINVTGEPPVTNNQGLSSVTPGSLGTLINGVNEGKKMSLDARIAYVIENGEPFCNHCEKNYIPTSFTRLACTYCGCGRPNDDHGLGEDNFMGEDLHTVEENLHTVESAKIEEGDVVDGDVIKTSDEHLAKKGSTEELINMFKKSNDSKLYYQGYYDAMDGKPLDEDLALLSDDYYHGYDQYKFYNKSPQQSSGQQLYDMKPNSNSIQRGEMTPEEADRGPLQLTDGTNRATAKKIAAIYPIDVIEKFFGDN